MKLAEHEVSLSGRLESAWEKLVDWKSMPKWDLFMKSVHFDGPLKNGSVGQLTLQDGNTYTLKVTSFNPLKDYTDEFSILGSRLIFMHELIPQGANRITMRFRVEGEGLLVFLLQGPIKNDLVTKLPDLMNRFKSQFEEVENAASR